MTCGAFEARLHAYVDGELSVADTAAADAHAGECRRCEGLARRERDFRRLLHRQPREVAPAELSARIVQDVRGMARRARRRVWLVAAPLAVGMAAFVAVPLSAPRREAVSLVGELVDKHIAYAQVEHPAEFASTDPAAIAAWFRERAGLRIVVPDFSPSGIHLVGARLAAARERGAAHLLYEKGRTLVSVFMVPVSAADVAGAGTRVTYRGRTYTTREMKGYRAVSWSDGRAAFGVVSMLDDTALLECADRLRTDRERQTSL